LCTGRYIFLCDAQRSRTQNARISVQVVRNTDLLGPSGPATADAFAYCTATVTAPEIVTPAIARTEPIPLQDATLETALQNAFATLFPATADRPDLKLTLKLFYGHALTEARARIRSSASSRPG
jgi:hypothetical protein